MHVAPGNSMYHTPHVQIPQEEYDQLLAIQKRARQLTKTGTKQEQVIAQAILNGPDEC